MDTYTQALLGATATQGLFHRSLGRHAWIIGAVGGVLPDADGLIRSATDPLLRIEFHRHFTHSLAFIPVGGLLAALPWMLATKYPKRRKTLLAAGTVAYATHAPLDCCTSYGTQLLWPFSSYRVAWHNVSVVDPVFSMALLIGLVFSIWRKRAAPALAALVFCVAYLLLGVVQRERAAAVQADVIASRGHEPVRAVTMPTLGNLVVWRSLYEAEGRLWSDGVRVGILNAPAWAPGASAEMVVFEDLPEAVRADERTARDFRRFAWFASGWLARIGPEGDVYGDVRYSLAPEGMEPIWGITLHPDNPEQPTRWERPSRLERRRLDELWQAITGGDPKYRPPPASQNK